MHPIKFLLLCVCVCVCARAALRFKVFYFYPSQKRRVALYLSMYITTRHLPRSGHYAFFISFSRHHLCLLTWYCEENTMRSRHLSRSRYAFSCKLFVPSLVSLTSYFEENTMRLSSFSLYQYIFATKLNVLYCVVEMCESWALNPRSKVISLNNLHIYMSCFLLQILPMSHASFLMVDF